MCSAKLLLIWVSRDERIHLKTVYVLKLVKTQIKSGFLQGFVVMPSALCRFPVVILRQWPKSAPEHTVRVEPLRLRMHQVVAAVTNALAKHLRKMKLRPEAVGRQECLSPGKHVLSCSHKTCSTWAAVQSNALKQIVTQDNV